MTYNSTKHETESQILRYLIEDTILNTSLQIAKQGQKTEVVAERRFFIN